MSSTTSHDSIKIAPWPAKSSSPRDGAIICAPDKSLTHRAIIFASLAHGDSTIHHPLLGADCRSTIACFTDLGVAIRVEGEGRAAKVRVSSRGAAQFKTPERPLDCGNSGTTARLLTGLFASLPGLRVTLTGDDSLSSRPMGRVVKPLRTIGAVIDGRDGGERLPLTIQGATLKADEHVVDKATAQVKSALLLAGLNIAGPTTVSLPEGSRDHTERMLDGMGAEISVRKEGGEEVVTLTGPFVVKPRNYRIPVDPSSAAFFAVLGLIRPGGKLTLPDVLDNPTRLGFLKVIERMSSQVKIERRGEGQNFVEPVCELVVQGGGELRATDISPGEVPTLVDEIPILAVLALFAKGTSRFRGLAELRVKESDRLAKTAELLTLAGGEVSIEGDDLIVRGGLSEAKAFTFDPAHDHRLAMAAAVLAKKARGPVTIASPEAVAVSFPGFFELLASLD